MRPDEIKEALRDIVNTPASKLTADDKLMLEHIAEQVGVEFKGKKGCKRCWHDLAMSCWSKMTESAPDESGRAYVLKAGVDVWFGNVRVNAATLTDELAERILVQGFERKFFAKCK